MTMQAIPRPRIAIANSDEWHRQRDQHLFDLEKFYASGKTPAQLRAERQQKLNALAGQRTRINSAVILIGTRRIFHNAKAAGKSFHLSGQSVLRSTRGHCLLSGHEFARMDWKLVEWMADNPDKPVTWENYPKPKEDAPSGLSGLSLAVITDAVARSFHISRREIFSDSRSNRLARARQICAYLINHTREYSLNEIARWLKYKDHTSICHGIVRIADLIESSPPWQKRIAEIERDIAQASGREMAA